MWWGLVKVCNLLWMSDDLGLESKINLVSFVNGLVC